LLIHFRLYTSAVDYHHSVTK